MAEPGSLAGMYGVETPDDVAAKRRAMSHTPEGVQARPEPQTGFGRQAAGLAGPDPELQALAQQAGDAPPMAPRMAPGTEALGGAMEGNLADVEYWQRQRQGLGKVVSRSRNEEFPIIQRQGEEMLAGEGQAPAQQPEFVPPERLPDEPDAAYELRNLLAMEDYDQAVAGMDPNVPAARDVGQGGNIGMSEAERRTQEGMTEAELQQNERMAGAEANAAVARREQIDASRIALQEERDFQMAQRDRLLQAQDVEQSTRKKLESMPALNGQRYTQNLKGWQKALFVISAAADGWRGTTGTTDALMKMNNEELEEQKLSHEMGLQSYDAAKGAVDQGMNLYGTLKNEMGDPVAAEMMFLNLLDEDQIALLREEAAKTTSPIRQQEILQQALQKEQALRDRRDQMQLRVSSAHEYNTRVSDPNRREREFAEEQLGESLTAQRGLRERGVDVGMAREKQEGAMELEGAKTRGAVQAKRIEGQAKSDMEIKKSSAKWGIVEQMGKDFLAGNTENIHGVGSPLSGDQGDRMKVRNFLDLYPEILTTAITGAVADPGQKEIAQDVIKGDWKEWGDDLLRQRIQEVVNMASANRRYLQNELGSSRPDVVDPTKELSSFRPQ